ncbi:MAG: cation transporter [bacterium]|nr:cation transporter [bacterium]
MNKHTYPVTGMHCTSCVNLIEKTLEKAEGVEACSVQFAQKTVTLTYDETKTSVGDFNTKIRDYGYEIEDSISQKDMASHHHGDQDTDTDKELGILRSNIKVMTPMLVIVGVYMIRMFGGKYARFGLHEMSAVWAEFFDRLLPILATYTLFVVGKRYLRAAFAYIKNRFRGGNMDTLVGISAIIAYTYSFIVTAFGELLSPYLDVTINFYEAVIVVV